jgi:Mrp family chromosome partitioning ATPase
LIPGASSEMSLDVGENVSVVSSAETSSDNALSFLPTLAENLPSFESLPEERTPGVGHTAEGPLELATVSIEMPVIEAGLVDRLENGVDDSQVETHQAPAVVQAVASKLMLNLAEVAKDLVALHETVGGTRTLYEHAAGKVLATSWRRTSLFFTSTHAEEGATEAAVNLAITLSRRAESTLLVQLQLAAPTLWSMLGHPAAKAGLEEALRGRSSFEDCLHEVAGQPLSIVLLKTPMTEDEAAHSSGGLNDFLEWAEERFAWIIVDCPPVLATTWTRWFELNADPVVLVARGGITRKTELRKAVARLGDQLAGTLLYDTRKQ